MFKHSVLVIVLVLCVSTTNLPATVVYVKKSAAGLNNGSSWTDAYTNLQAAILAAVSNSEIWVAAGIYVPGTGRTDTFQLKEWVDLYGGFNGTETSRSQRDWTNSLSVLSGDILGNDVGFSNNTENAYHVIEATNNVTVDGFIIRGGNANGTTNNVDGGGMHSWYSSPTVQNCVFSNNYAVRHGGGLSFYLACATVRDCSFFDNSAAQYGGGLDNGVSTCVVERCVFSRNYAYRGGGIYNGSAPTSLVQACVFSGNSANSGGGIYNNNAPIVQQDCIFSGNSASSGGGVYNSSAPAVLKSCIFSGNSAANDGGAVRNHYSAISAQDCIFSQNSASVYGGGMLNNNCSPLVENCVFSGNRSLNVGGAMYNVYSSLTIRKCVFSGNSTAEAGGGMVNAYEYPSVVNSMFCGNMAKYGGGIANGQAHATITNCTFSGNSADSGGAIDNEPAWITVVNSILWNNSGSGSEIFNTDTGSVTLLSCDIKGGWDGTNVVNQDSATVTNGGGNINLDPIFALETNGTWKANAQYASNAFQSILADTGAAWIPGALAGRFVRPNMSNNLQYLIVSNSATTLAIWGDFSTNSLNGRPYRLYDYRLQTNSPCLDNGTSSNAPGDDVEGVARPLDGDDDGNAEPDIGCYEAAFGDTDKDGYGDADEIIAGTSPTNAQDYFEIRNISFGNAAGSNRCVVFWNSAAGRLYTLQGTTNLTGNSWASLPDFTGIPGTGSTMSYTNSFEKRVEFYRARVKKQ